MRSKWNIIVISSPLCWVTVLKLVVSSGFPFFYWPVAFQSFGGFLLCPPFIERSLKPLLWVKLCHPKVHTLKFYLLAPQNVTASGHRIFKKVTKLKCSHKCGSWSNRSGVIKKGNSDTGRHQGMTLWRHRRRWPSTGQGERHQKKPIRQTLQSQTSSFQN